MWRVRAAPFVVVVRRAGGRQDPGEPTTPARERVATSKSCRGSRLCADYVLASATAWVTGEEAASAATSNRCPSQRHSGRKRRWRWARHRQRRRSCRESTLDEVTTVARLRDDGLTEMETARVRVRVEFVFRQMSWRERERESQEQQGPINSVSWDARSPEHTGDSSLEDHRQLLGMTLCDGPCRECHRAGELARGRERG